jgi:hypothetical protein
VLEKDPIPSGGRRLTKEGSFHGRREESIREKAPPFVGRKEGTRRLGIAPESQGCQARGRAYATGRSPISSQEHTWRMHGSNLLLRTCRRHHYRGRRSNDGQDRLVVSHQCSMQDSLKDNSVHSPAGLLHLPRPHDTCLAYRPTTVLSP